MNMRDTAILFAALTLATAGACQEVNTPPDWVVEHNVSIAMRDAAVLRAEVMRPKKDGRFPVLVYRTPYGKDAALKEYTTFRHAVERGYAVVVEDVRGRYASDGEFTAYEHEGKDGFDTIEWAARQPWSDGNVGTFGLSYPGAVQWLAAVENPPHLKAMVPAMTFSTPQNFFYAWGMWDMSWIDWIWFNIAPDVRMKKDLPGPHTYQEAKDAWGQAGPAMQNALPLSEMPELKKVAPFYYDWLSHPPEDPWWDWAELHGKYGRTQAAVLNLSAWYDDNYGPEGATTNYLGLLRARAQQADKRTHLLLGPWVHGVDATGKPEAGERKFASSAAIDYDETVLRWMDHYLRGIDNGVDREKPVRYYVMGADAWRDSEVWPPAARPVTYFLASDAQGKLSLETSAPSAKEAYSSMVSDPADPVRNPYSSSGAHDYRALGKRHDVLEFDSPPLAEAMEVRGPITARIYLSCDCRDADLWVRLLDVAPDGTAMNLMSPGLDGVRVSYRDLKKGRQLLQPNRVYAVVLDHMLTGNQFAAGHRLRAQVSASFFPNFARNLQTGESNATSARMQKATLSIYHDRAHASQITMPVANP